MAGSEDTVGGESPRDPAEDLSRLAREAAYTVLGLGVLAFQRAQVHRRQLHRRLATPRPEVGPALRRARASVRSVTDPVLDEVEKLLPEPGRSAVHLVRVGAVTAGDRVMDLIDPSPPRASA